MGSKPTFRGWPLTQLETVFVYAFIVLLLGLCFYAVMCGTLCHVVGLKVLYKVGLVKAAGRKSSAGTLRCGKCVCERVGRAF